MCKPARGTHFRIGGGGGTLDSGDWTFCIVTLAALDLDTCLDECSSGRSDQPSVDKVRGKTHTVLN